MSVSAAIITKNEEVNLAACLQTLGWADEVVLADSGSTDRTVALARSLGAKVIEAPFIDFAAHKNIARQYALGDWVFFIDADERVTPELKEQILRIVKEDRRDAVYAVKRKTYLFGRLFSTRERKRITPFGFSHERRLNFNNRFMSISRQNFPFEKFKRR